MGTEVLLPINRQRVDAPKMNPRLAALFGFLFGFALAFITLLQYDNTVNEVLSERPSTQLITTSDDTAKSSTWASIVPEPNLFQEVRVVCMVLTFAANHERTQHVKDTWGKRCNRIIFISDEDDKDLNAVDVDVVNNHDNLWEKTRKGFKFVYDNLLNEGEWFLKADDDTYVVMENLRYMLYAYNPEMPIYFGHKFSYGDGVYMSGGGGYVLSKEAFRRFMTEAFYNETICVGDVPNSEDVQMGRCLANVGVIAGNSTDPFGHTQRFHPFELSNYMQTDAKEWIPEWTYQISVDPIFTGPNCCSEYAISFHYLTPEQMYLYDFLLYRMRAHGVKKPFRVLPHKYSMDLG